MSLKVGIVGLPNVGKSTLFKAITQKKVEIAAYPFSTINPNVGIVAVPDVRLQKLSKLLPRAQVFPAVIEAVDVAGLVKGAHQGAGLGNQFLSHLLGMEVLLFLIRLFQDESIPSLSAGPAEELAILKEELAAKGLNRPSLVVCNLKNDGENFQWEGCEFKIDAAQEKGLDKLIQALYQKLGLITFYTLKGGKELRAWAVKRGTLAPTAGGQVHTDFEQKFIRAEVISAEKLLEAGGWLEARKRGLIKTCGRDWEVKDGNVIEFKI